MKKYYVYEHIREDKNEVFYIGIGTKSKQDLKYGSYTRAKAIHYDNSIWLRIVNKTNWKYNILFESHDRKEVENMEILLIKQYGRKCVNEGCLANMTLGGESNKGYKFTDAQRQRISDAQKGKPGRRLGAKLTTEQKENFSKIHKEIANRPDRIEYRRQLALGNSYNLGNKHSDEAKAKMSESAKKRGVNAKCVKCELEIIKTKEIFKANSLEEMARISPISINTIRRIYKGNYNGNWIGTKINIKFYE